MTASELKELAYVMANIDRDELEHSGIIKRGQVGGGDWARYNDDPLMFIIKLPQERLMALAELITAKTRKA